MSDHPTDPESLKRFMAEMEAYADKEIQRPMDDEPMQEAIVVDYLWGDKVALRDGDPDVVGRVVLIEAGPCGVRYEVSWAPSREFSQHYGFELESAD